MKRKKFDFVSVKIILIVIGSFVFTYCFTAFYYADFNFANWSFDSRFFTGWLGFGLAIMGVLIMIMFDNDN